MRLSEAADVIGVTKHTLWRAVKAGKLEAVRIKRGSRRAEYDVTEDAIAAYQAEYLECTEVPVVTDVTEKPLRSDIPVTDATEEAMATYQVKYHVADQTLNDHTATAVTDETNYQVEYHVTEETLHADTPVTDETSRYATPVTPVSGPPAEVYSLMLDRISRAERRNVELELILRQHQNLLAENAESLQEGRAEALEAEAKLEAERREREAKEAAITQLTEELKEARSTLAQWEEQRQRPWWKKIFSAG